MTGLLILLVVLLMVSAFFSGSELALFSIGDARVRALERAGERGAGTLARLKANPERLLTTILVGNNVANIAAASIATALALEAFGREGVAVATGAMTLLVLIFGEIVPKSFAATHAVRASLFIAPIIYFLSRALLPVVAPLESLTRWMVSRGDVSLLPRVTEAEIREMTAIGHKEGEIDRHERELIDRAFRLDRTRAWDVMTPRVDIFAWRGGRTLGEVAPELPDVPYSRIPVFRETIDDIIGILHIRDVFEALLAGRGDVRLESLVRPPFMVPGSVPVTRLLEDFQLRRIHMGMVIDEYGGTDGLVTLEDILEELVGEIEDETDLARQPVVRVSADEILVEGSTELREINKTFRTTLPQAEHRSLNGYLLEEMGYVPDEGEELEREGILIRVEQATETQVIRARLIRQDPEPGADREEAEGQTSNAHGR